MPLDKSGTEASVGKNIKKMEKEGVKKKQAVAIALNVERDNAKGSRKAKLEEAYGRFLGKRDAEWTAYTPTSTLNGNA